MLKLLSEGFSKVIKNKFLWGLTAFAVVMAVVISLLLYDGGLREEIDGAFFIFAVAVPFVASVFVPVFIGADYSDGTIRNKLVCGHRRVSIYFSGLIVSLAVVMFLTLLYAAVASALSVPLICKFKSGAEVMKNLVCVLLMGSCFTCIFSTACYLVSNRTAATVACLVIALALTVISVYIGAALEAPPTYTWVNTDELGNVIGHHEVPNPQYISGAARSFCLFLMDFLPSGQAVRLSFFGVSKHWTLALYSIAISIATTAAGIVTFRVKDIK